MVNLNILDLSHNYLRTISYKTFIYTKNLKKLDISYNNLYINGPFLEIDSLEVSLVKLIEFFSCTKQINIFLYKRF